MDKEKLKSILIKANTLQEGKEIALASEFISIDEKINDTAKEIDLKLSEIQEDLKKKLEEELIYEVDEQKIVQSVLSKVEIPDPIPGKDGKSGKDGKDYILTKNDKEEIASFIEVPIVEKVVEKTEIIKEIPEEITGENIVDKINELEIKPEKQIDAKHIKNLPKVENIGGGTKYLQYLADVKITSPSNSQVLKYNATSHLWENGTDTTGGSTWDKPFGDAEFTYDVDGNVETKTVGLTVLTFTYDVDGNVETISDGTNTKTFSYNANGDVEAIIYS